MISPLNNSNGFYPVTGQSGLQGGLNNYGGYGGGNNGLNNFNAMNSVDALALTNASLFRDPFKSMSVSETLARNADAAYILGGDVGQMNLNYKGGWYERIKSWITAKVQNRELIDMGFQAPFGVAGTNGKTLAAQLREILEAIANNRGSVNVLANGDKSNLYDQGPSGTLIGGLINQRNNPSNFDYIGTTLIPILQAVQQLAMDSNFLSMIGAEALGEQLLGTVQELTALQAQAEQVKELKDPTNMGNNARKMLTDTTSKLQKSMGQKAGGSTQGGQTA